MDITGTTEQRRAQLDVLFKENKIVEVTFTKVDGSIRVMPCSLDSSVVPPAPAPKVLAECEVPKIKKHNPNTMSVFCTDKAEWRSFRIDNVVSAKAL